MSRRSSIAARAFALLLVGITAISILYSGRDTSLATTDTTSTTSTTSTTTVAPDPYFIQQKVIGRSTQGRPIVAIERGTPDGVVVLVVGAIHGDEDAGIKIVDQLVKLPVPKGIDLWLIPTVNPDGVALQIRGTVNGVDLNRNFPYNWGPIAKKGNWQWAGLAAKSEPETKATVRFISKIKPAMVIWYHQDLYRISPSTGKEGRIRARYAELTGLPIKTISGGVYTGVAATWQRKTVQGSIGFVVELGRALSAKKALIHAKAVLTVAKILR